MGVKYIMFDGWDFEKGWEFNSDKNNKIPKFHYKEILKFTNDSFIGFTIDIILGSNNNCFTL